MRQPPKRKPTLAELRRGNLLYAPLNVQPRKQPDAATPELKKVRPIEPYDDTVRLPTEDCGR